MPANDVFNKIASEIGIEHYSGDSETEFCRRVTYSASRFWASAFCMDDGGNGSSGLSQQGLTIRIRRWIQSMISFYPDMEDWFQLEHNGASYVSKRLIDISDILPAGRDGRCFARTPRIEPISETHALLLGFFEPSLGNPLDRESEPITSGLSTLVTGKFKAPSPQQPWWESDQPYMAWTDLSALPKLEYANPCGDKWGLGAPETWREFSWEGSQLSLARHTSTNKCNSDYYAVRKAEGTTLASKIGKHMAYELFFHLKKQSGKPIRIHYTKRSETLVSVFLPITILPPRVSAIADALSWPENCISDNMRRLFKAEALDAIKPLLKQYEIETEG